MAKNFTVTKRGRDARTGQFIPIKDALKDKSHTTVETIKLPKKH